MKESHFNLNFILLNAFILVISIFIFPNYTSITNGLCLQSIFIALLIGLHLTLEVLLPKRSFKKIIGACFLTFNFYYLLDSFSLYRSSFHFIDLVRIAFLGGDIFATLTEVGIPPILGIVLLVIPISILALNLWIYKKLDRQITLPQKFIRFFSIAFFILMLLTFTIEQVLNSNKSSYLIRKNHLPVQIQLFDSKWKSFKFSKSNSQEELTQFIQSSEKPINSNNILLIILEGVHADALDAKATPFLFNWAKNAQSFPNAMTEAISTHLALNSLLFNRPAYSFESDIENLSHISYGALPFEIYKKNNYEIYLGVSTDFSMKFDEIRALGKNQTVDHYYKGFNGSYVGRNVTDNLTADQAVEWLNKQDPTKPFLMTLQFDCTHWPYEFDATNAVFEPYLKTDRLDKFDSSDLTNLVINRYKNSLRHLDQNIEKVLNSLSKNNFDKKTSIVIISDHGENFKKGFVTHLNLSENSKKIFNLFYFPTTSLHLSNSFISHRDVWPTLMDYSNIQLSNNPFHGFSLFKTVKRDSLFTVNGNLRRAELSYNDKVIHFYLSIDGENLLLSPYLITDKSGQPLADWQKQITKINWEADIQNSLY